MELDRIIDKLEQALVASATSFEAAANGHVQGVNWCADRMPESWIVACLMRALQEDGIASLPEVRVRRDLQYFESGGKTIDPEDVPDLKKGGAKLDLVLGEQSSLSGIMRLRVAMEIKGPKSNWQQFQSDIDRLHQLKGIISSKDQALIFAYVSGPLLDTEWEEHDRKLVQSTGLSLPEFRVSSAPQDSLATDGVRRARAYMHIIRG